MFAALQVNESFLASTKICSFLGRFSFCIIFNTKKPNNVECPINKIFFFGYLHCTIQIFCPIKNVSNDKLIIEFMKMECDIESFKLIIIFGICIRNQSEKDAIIFGPQLYE